MDNRESFGSRFESWWAQNPKIEAAAPGEERPLGMLPVCWGTEGKAARSIYSAFVNFNLNRADFRRFCEVEHESPRSGIVAAFVQLPAPALAHALDHAQPEHAVGAFLEAATARNRRLAVRLGMAQ